MSDSTLVSVVIASYNMARFISQAIQSVLDQTYSNLEIHVVDDGSTDNTKELMQDFKKENRFNYYYQPNSGQAKAKNKGIRESKGKFIAFIDADDLWLPDKLEKQLRCFKDRQSVGIVYTNLATIDEDGKWLEISRHSKDRYSGNITKKLLIDNFVTGMTSLVRRECFEQIGLFDESLPMGIDYDLWLRFSTKYEFLYFDEVTYLYRIWTGQMSKNSLVRYECGKRIMNNFIKANRSLLDDDCIDTAWTHMYMSKGDYLAQIKGGKREAIKYYIKALKINKTYIHAWKAIMKVIFMDIKTNILKINSSR